MNSAATIMKPEAQGDEIARLTKALDDEKRDNRVLWDAFCRGVAERDIAINAIRVQGGAMPWAPLDLKLEKEAGR